MASISDITCPIQTIIVSCRGRSKIVGKDISKDNLITIDWHSQLNIEPLMYMISIGKSRFSHGLIKESRVFCVNFIEYMNAKEITLCGTKSGKFEDKFSLTKFHKEECAKIDCCRIKEAAAFLECEVSQEIDLEDHTVFIGRVLNSGINKKNSKRALHLGFDFTTTK